MRDRNLEVKMNTVSKAFKFKLTVPETSYILYKYRTIGK